MVSGWLVVFLGGKFPKLNIYPPLPSLHLNPTLSDREGLPSNASKQCHDISFIKVLTTHWEAVYLKLKFFQYLRNRSGAKRSFPVSANSQNGALGQTGELMISK